MSNTCCHSIFQNGKSSYILDPRTTLTKLVEVTTTLISLNRSNKRSEYINTCPSRLTTRTTLTCTFHCITITANLLRPVDSHDQNAQSHFLYSCSSEVAKCTSKFPPNSKKIHRLMSKSIASHQYKPRKWTRIRTRGFSSDGQRNLQENRVYQNSIM